MEKQEISKEALKELREMLPQGSNNKIATATGYTPGYVSNLLNAHESINGKNIIILEQAQKIAKEEKDRLNAKITKLNTFLSESKA